MTTRQLDAATTGIATTGRAQLVALISESHAAAVFAMASDGNADDTLVLPHEVDKSRRAQVHRLISQLCPALLTDTVDAGSHQSMSGLTREAAAAVPHKSVRVQSRWAAQGNGKRRCGDFVASMDYTPILSESTASVRPGRFLLDVLHASAAVRSSAEEQLEELLSSSPEAISAFFSSVLQPSNTQPLRLLAATVLQRRLPTMIQRINVAAIDVLEAALLQNIALRPAVGALAALGRPLQACKVEKRVQRDALIGQLTALDAAAELVAASQLGTSGILLVTCDASSQHGSSGYGLAAVLRSINAGTPDVMRGTTSWTTVVQRGEQQALVFGLNAALGCPASERRRVLIASDDQGVCDMFTGRTAAPPSAADCEAVHALQTAADRGIFIFKVQSCHGQDAEGFEDHELADYLASEACSAGAEVVPFACIRMPKLGESSFDWLRRERVPPAPKGKAKAINKHRFHRGAARVKALREESELALTTSVKPLNRG